MVRFEPFVDRYWQ